MCVAVPQWQHPSGEVQACYYYHYYGWMCVAVPQWWHPSGGVRPAIIIIIMGEYVWQCFNDAIPAEGLDLLSLSLLWVNVCGSASTTISQWRGSGPRSLQATSESSQRSSWHRARTSSACRWAATRGPRRLVRTSARAAWSSTRAAALLVATDVRDHRLASHCPELHAWHHTATRRSPCLHWLWDVDRFFYNRSVLVFKGGTGVSK